MPRNRKHPARYAVIERRNQPAILFLTVCTKNRKKVLANTDVQDVLVDAWSSAAQWQVGHFLIMPDHVHLFCSPSGKESEPINSWVTYWKRLVSREFPELQPIWQRYCWDTQLRSADHYGDKWEYVRQNPVRAGLVSRSDAWLFQGCCVELRW